MSLPSGLGAGGRGKEKAPCRYLHYEVDWDEKDAHANGTKGNQKGTTLTKPHRIGIGMGPDGTNMKVVGVIHLSAQSITDIRLLVAPAVDQL